MTYPKVIVTSGIEIDAHNYALTYLEANESFFQPKNYFILPYIPKHKNIAGKTIFLPDVANEIDRSSQTQLESALHFSNINLISRKEYINLAFNGFWTDIIGIFGATTFKKIEIIEFQISNVGSGGRSIISEDRKKIIVRNRKDMLNESMLSTLLMGLVKYNGYTEDYTWEEKTAIRTWVERNTVLKKYFPKEYIPMLSNLRLAQQQGKYQLESIEYLKKIGIQNDLEIYSDGEVSLNGNILTLSKNEQSLIKILNDNRGAVVDFDTIYNYVWQNNLESFSLYSITKLVQRTRIKLKAFGFPTDLIITVKGKGYCIR